MRHEPLPLSYRPLNSHNRSSSSTDSIKDFSADFVHTYQGGVLRKQLTEHGHVLIKKPGKMRWEYMPPEKKLFVSDGIKVYSYVPEDKQVIVGTVPEGDQAGDAGVVPGGQGQSGARLHAATPTSRRDSRRHSGGQAGAESAAVATTIR